MNSKIISDIITKVLKNNENISKEEFIKKVSGIAQKYDNKTLDVLNKKLGECGFDSKKTNNEISFIENKKRRNNKTGEKEIVKVKHNTKFNNYSINEINDRKEFQQNFQKTYIEFSYNTDKDADIINKAIKDHNLVLNQNERMVTDLFRMSLKFENTKFSLNNLLDVFTDPNKTTIEKQNLFNDYIVESSNYAKTHIKGWSNNEEYLENYIDNHFCGLAFNFNVKDFKELVNDFNFKPLDKTIDTYSNINNLAASTMGYIGQIKEVLLDPSYPLLDAKNAEKLEKFVDVNQKSFKIVIDELSDDKEYEAAKPIISVGLFNLTAETYPTDDFKLFYENSINFDPNKKYILNDKKIDVIQAKESFLNGERVVEFDGKKFNNYQLSDKMMMYGENSFYPLYTSDTKDRFKNDLSDYLDSLNKNTRWYNKSSEEYKKMRSILSDIKKNDYSKEDLKGKVNEIKDLSNKYLSNYKTKESPSKLAVERMKSVQSLNRLIDKMSESLDINADLILEKEIDKETNINNSRVKLSNEECDKILSLVNENKQIKESNPSIETAEENTKQLNETANEKEQTELS